MTAYTRHCELQSGAAIHPIPAVLLPGSPQSLLLLRDDECGERFSWIGAAGTSRVTFSLRPCERSEAIQPIPVLLFSLAHQGYRPLDDLNINPARDKE